MNKPKRSVYLATVKRVHNGKAYVSHLLRHTYREGGQIKQLTLGSLTELPDDVIELIRRRLNKGEPIGSGGEGAAATGAMTISRSCAVCRTGTSRWCWAPSARSVSTSCSARPAAASRALIALRLIRPGGDAIGRAGRGRIQAAVARRTGVSFAQDHDAATAAHLSLARRPHSLLCMLAYYVQWHLRRDLRPLLFHDKQREAAEQQRASIVHPAPRSELAVRKQRERCTEDGLPVQSLRCLLRDLATICRNTVRWRSSSGTFERVTLPTDSQRRALELRGVSLEAPK